MKQKKPLYLYVIGVFVVWAGILSITLYSGDPVRFQTFALLCAGFVLGMISMYIATKIYK